MSVLQHADHVWLLKAADPCDLGLCMAADLDLALKVSGDADGLHFWHVSCSGSNIDRTRWWVLGFSIARKISIS